MLTVLFATRDRASLLPRVLAAFAALQAPPGGWQLLVVDNGSGDGTPALLASWTKRLPLTPLSCPAAGKNRALNTALPHLRGDLVVLTDDDVIPDPDWLLRLQAASEAHPEAGFLGGTVLPEWPGPVPPWLTEPAVEFSVLYAQKVRPSGPCGATDVFGPNMAVRRRLFDAGLRFAEHVGPEAGNARYAMGSETELLRRLEAAGERGWFEASARVGHIVRPEQMEERWILARAHRYGLGEGRNHAGRLTAGPPVLGGLPAPLLLRLATYGIAAPLAGLLPPSARRLRIRYRACWLAGVAEGFRQTAVVPVDPLISAHPCRGLLNLLRLPLNVFRPPRDT